MKTTSTKPPTSSPTKDMSSAFYIAFLSELVRQAERRLEELGVPPQIWRKLEAGNLDLGFSAGFRSQRTGQLKNPEVACAAELAALATLAMKLSDQRIGLTLGYGIRERMEKLALPSVIENAHRERQSKYAKEKQHEALLLAIKILYQEDREATYRQLIQRVQKRPDLKKEFTIEKIDTKERLVLYTQGGKTRSISFHAISNELSKLRNPKRLPPSVLSELKRLRRNKALRDNLVDELLSKMAPINLIQK